jgi:hypothetical protein
LCHFQSRWIRYHRGLLRGCIQKFPDWVDNEISSRWEATQRVMAAKFTGVTHKIAIQLHLVAESCTICSSRSRRPVRKLLDTPSYMSTVAWGKLPIVKQQQFISDPYNPDFGTCYLSCCKSWLNWKWCNSVQDVGGIDPSLLCIYRR